MNSITHDRTAVARAQARPFPSVIFCGYLLALASGCGAATDDAKEPPNRSAAELDDAPTSSTSPTSSTMTDDLPDDPPDDGSTDAEPAQTRTETRTETSCTGSFVNEPCEANGDDAGVGGCGELPCHFNDQVSCEAQSGCSWETKTIENEGTDSGKSCSGEPLACGELNALCPTGCEQNPEGATRQERCSGTPTPCGAIAHSIECKSQRGCRWD
jgi:hypothetical protein